jgi:hypothetical protein
VKRIPSYRGILGERIEYGTCPRSNKRIPQEIDKEAKET